MNCLADTNILTALVKRQSFQYLNVRHALTTLRKRGDKICIVPQSLIEFWAVATRPVDVNGLGLDSVKASLEVRKFKRYFILYNESANIFNEWEKLVVKYKILGKNVHDARLVAAMVEHQIETLITFNHQDFKRFDEIKVISPSDIAG